MLQLSEMFQNRYILSLRTGTPIGQAIAPVINPKNLKIEGWYATAKGEKEPMILPVSEVRDIIAKGIVVNDHDAITPEEDLVRLQDVLAIRYELIGKRVESETGDKLGKVQEYAADSKTMFVKKLYLKQGLLGGISKDELIIDRTQIIDVTEDKIVVKEATEKVDVKSPAPATA